MELFGLRTLDRPVCYWRIPAWWGQYDVPTLLFVPTLPLLSNYTGLVRNGSADDKTRLWTVVLKVYVFLANVMFLINAKHGACLICYTHNRWLDRVSDSLLFQLSVKVLDALKYFVLFKFAQSIGADPVSTTIVFHRCAAVDWEKTAAGDGFVSYDFRTCEVYGREEESIPAVKRIRGNDGARSPIVLPAVPLYFREGFERTLLEANRHG